MISELKYQVISKAEIPKRKEAPRYYGDWKALANLLRLLPADKAVVLPFGLDKYASCIRNAGRAVGVRVSTAIIDGKLYVVRTGFLKPREIPKRKAECPACHEVFETTYPQQTHCGKEACSRERGRKARRAYKRRQRQLAKELNQNNASPVHQRHSLETAAGKTPPLEGREDRHLKGLCPADSGAKSLPV